MQTQKGWEPGGSQPNFSPEDCPRSLKNRVESARVDG